MAGWLRRAVLTCALSVSLALPVSAQTRGGTFTYASGGGIGRKAVCQRQRCQQGP